MVWRIVGWGLAVLAAVAVAAFVFLPGIVESGLNRTTRHEPYDINPDVLAFHNTLTVGDLHADSFLWHRDLAKRSSRGHVDLPRLREGNVAVQVFSAVTKSPAGLNVEENDAEASDSITSLVMIQRWPMKTWDSLRERAQYIAHRADGLAERVPDEFRVIRSRGDLEAVLEAREGGTPMVGGLLALEGSHPLEADLDNIAVLWDAGYRMAGLQHFFDNALGGSLHGMDKDGLTDFGRAAVAAYLERGMILDLAHSSEAVVREVLEMSDRPAVVSHTGIQSVCDTGRNISDELMQQIAAEGGLIGIGFWETAVCDDTPAGIVRTIRAAIDLLGVEHVALGSDYDGSVRVTFDASELAVLTREMLAADFTTQEIRAVMGGNLVRFLRETLPE